ncbi:MAG: hypothetical protein NC120_11145 [Ruminococcus sp.]|nr:hypothetical protein [Ruminococcus sp.]
MKRTSLIKVLLLSAWVLCSCGKTADSLPEDNPANHWTSPVMETDKGYFSNGRYMYLRYYEKNSGNELFLCAKPECMHEGGDGCTATYMSLKVVNTLMYDGSIYIYTVSGENDTVSFSLYKAAADGSSVTKVGDAFTVENSAGETYDYSNEGFIIHKGFAYLPYHLNMGDSTFGFAGSGLVKMDISSGKTETIVSGENYFSPYPLELQGSGDKVYFRWSDTVAHTSETRSYDINTGEIKQCMYFQAAGKDSFYSAAAYDDGTYGLWAFPKDIDVSGDPEHIYEEMELVIEKFEGYPRDVMYCDGKLVIIFDGKIEVYDESGGFLGKIDIDPLKEGYEDHIQKQIIFSFAVLNDRLYAKASNFSINDPVDSRIYSADMNDLGGGWTKAYEIREAYIIDNERGSDYIYSAAFANEIIR